MVTTSTTGCLDCCDGDGPGCVICGVVTDFNALINGGLVVAFSGTGCVGANLPADAPVSGGTFRYPAGTGPLYVSWGVENATAGCPTGYVFGLRCTPAGLVGFLIIQDFGAFAQGENSITCAPCDFDTSNDLGGPLAVTTPGPVCDAAGFVSQQFTTTTPFGTFTVTVVLP